MIFLAAGFWLDVVTGGTREQGLCSVCLAEDEFMYPCDECEGAGVAKVLAPGYAVPCPQCHGTGEQPKRGRSA